MTGQEPDALAPLLRELVRRELLRADNDPRSPERGQYIWVQAVLREVAYATLSKRDRRSRHLAAARYFDQLGDEVSAGQPAGLIHFPDTPWREPVLASFARAGTVICKRMPCRAERGDCLFHLGTPYHA